MSAITLCPHCMSQTERGERICRHCGKSVEAHNAVDQLPVGTVLNRRYLIGSSIGGGGFGITYIGYDMLLNIRVAIKEYYPSGAANRSGSVMVYPTSSDRGSSYRIGLERFLNEAKVLSQFIDDPNVVSLRDFFEANGTAYIVMEFLDGQDLRIYLESRGPLHYDEAMKLLAPAMDCLGRIHAKGIIHGDISPSNIMLLQSGEIKILDFGTARNQGSSEDYDAAAMLKPGFAPPEQFRNRGELGTWTDVYAICATMYKLLTGVTPENATDRYYEDKLLPPRKLGAKLSRVQEAALMKGMAVQVKDRTQSMAALRESFEKKSLSPGDLFTAGMRKKALRIGAAAAAVLVVIGACFTLSRAGVLRSGGKPTQGTGSDPGKTSVVSTPEPEKTSGAGTPEPGKRSVMGVPEPVTLSENAYPISLYAGMDRMKGFEAQTLLKNKYYKVEVSDCFIGNGELCFLLDISNRSDKAFSIHNLALQWGVATVALDEYISVGANSEITTPVWVNTDMMYLEGIKAFDKLTVVLDWYSELKYSEFGSYDPEVSVLRFPNKVELQSTINTTPEQIWTGPFKDYYGEEIGTELECYGLSLRKDHYEGVVLLKAAIDNQDAYLSIDAAMHNDELYADGVRVFNQPSGSVVTLDEYQISGTETVFAVTFHYGYSAATDEMNVMHSGAQLPETITLTLRLKQYSNEGEISVALDPLTFSVNSDGIGTLQRK